MIVIFLYRANLFRSTKWTAAANEAFADTTKGPRFEHGIRQLDNHDGFMTHGKVLETVWSHLKHMA